MDESPPPPRARNNDRQEWKEDNRADHEYNDKGHRTIQIFRPSEVMDFVHITHLVVSCEVGRRIVTRMDAWHHD